MGFSVEWDSADGNYQGLIRVTEPEDTWPSMVNLELFDPGGCVNMTMQVEDARALIGRIADAAEAAERERG